MEYQYPTVELFLSGREIVETWCVDDVMKSLKRTDDAVRKFEVSLARDKNLFGVTSEQTRILKEIRDLQARLAEQLNRLLGASY